MSDIQAFTPTAIPAARPAQGAAAARVAQDIAVDIVEAAQIADLRPAWLDLSSRAEAANVFMDPAMLCAAAAVDPDTRYRAVLAWKAAGGRRLLVGAWVCAVRRPRKSPLPVSVLAASAYFHGYLATPMIDRACLDDTLDAMLDAIAAAPDLPSIVALDCLATDGATMEALNRVLARRNSVPCVFEQFRRPKLVAGGDGKSYLEKALSSSSRKKLRQHRRRLGEKGVLTSEIATEPAAVRNALEQFLNIEAAGWKGREGTALLSKPDEAAFMRAVIGALADQGCASVHGLYLDGAPVSLQLVVSSGGTAFTWKTAYDEVFQDFSPGMLLLEDYTTAFLADPTIEAVDSCSLDDTCFMATWTGRQPVADLWIDARRGGSLSFAVLSRMQKTYRGLRAAAKARYLKFQQLRKH
jgi:CelD/BcsL family acetyltransferase involved in cellulose biosynthesis